MTSIEITLTRVDQFSTSALIVPFAFPQTAALIVHQEKEKRETFVRTKVGSFPESRILIMTRLIADLWGRPIMRMK